MARPPEAARARSIARAPGAPRVQAQTRAQRARNRCRAAASCAILHRAIGAVVLAQRQGEAERAAFAVTGRLRPHAAAVRRNDAVAEVEAEPPSRKLSR